MNQERIGKFIKELRTKEKMSQQQFALKYGVTYQAVSKWETGKNIPDIQIISKICQDYGIDMEDFLKAEAKKKNKSKILMGGMLFLISILIILAFLYFLFHHKTFEFKTLSASCDNFSLYGSLAYNSNKSSIYITNITYCGEEENTKYEKMNCILYEENGKTKTKINEYNYEKEGPILLDEFLKKVHFNIDNYETTCKSYTENSLFLEIEAITKEGKNTVYKIPLKLEDNCKR